MTGLLKRLREPFPERRDLASNFKYMIGVGVFVAAFLFVLRPFGLDGHWRQILPICLGFGLVTVGCGLIMELVLRYVLNLRSDSANWTLGKWIILAMVNLLWIALGNFLYVNYIMDWQGLRWGAFLAMMVNTFIVGIFPVAFSGIMIQMRSLKQNQAVAEGLDVFNRDEDLGSLYLDGMEEPILYKEIRYIESAQNYVFIHHTHAGELRKEMLRATMKSLTAGFEDSRIIRCHRSFFVNLAHVTRVEGNAQGLRLTLADTPEEVPVSRGYLDAVRESLA